MSLAGDSHMLPKRAAHPDHLGAGLDFHFLVVCTLLDHSELFPPLYNGAVNSAQSIKDVHVMLKTFSPS